LEKEFNLNGLVPLNEFKNKIKVLAEADGVHRVMSERSGASIRAWLEIILKK